jgi:hypothetical protein
VFTLSQLMSARDKVVCMYKVERENIFNVICNLIVEVHLNR